MWRGCAARNRAGLRIRTQPWRPRRRVGAPPSRASWASERAACVGARGRRWWCWSLASWWAQNPSSGRTGRSTRTRPAAPSRLGRHKACVLSHQPRVSISGGPAYASGGHVIQQSRAPTVVTWLRAVLDRLRSRRAHAHPHCLLPSPGLLS